MLLEVKSIPLDTHVCTIFVGLETKRIPDDMFL